MSQVKCSDCNYYDTDEICNNSKSQYYQKKTENTNSCEFFEKKPSLQHFAQGLIKSLNDDPSGAIKEFQQALKMGLPMKEAVAAHDLLGQALFKLSEDVKDEYAASAINEIEKALTLDAQGGYGHFLVPIIRAASFYRLQIAYILKAKSLIQKKYQSDEAIKYLEQKHKLFDYLTGTHLVLLNFELGELYWEIARLERDKFFKDKATTFLKRTIEAEVLHPKDPLEVQTKEKAQRYLDDLKSSFGCFIATAVYGSEFAPEVLILRRFRDEILHRSAIGRLFESCYYFISPRIAKKIISLRIEEFLKKAILNPFVRMVNENFLNKLG